MFFNKKKKKILLIKGMHCEKCAERVKNSLEEISLVNKVKVNLKDGNATIYYDMGIDNELLSNKIEELGYSVIGIKDIN